MKKSLVTLGLAAMMLVSTVTTAFAYEHKVITEKESVMTIGGQKPSLTMGYAETDRPYGTYKNQEVYQYDVYLLGRDTLTASDIQIESGWTVDVWDYSKDYYVDSVAWTGQSIKIPAFNDVDKEVTFEVSKIVGDTQIRNYYNFMANPSAEEIVSYRLQNLVNLDEHTLTGATVEAYLPLYGTNYYYKYGDTTGTVLNKNLDEANNKWVFTPVGKYLDMSNVSINRDYWGELESVTKADGSYFTENDEAFLASPVSTAQPVDKGAGYWASNDKGWWIQYNDGSYLTNAWYQSPASGLWYYMGADGYMLTNTTTPDGYTVNADGVWVQ